MKPLRKRFFYAYLFRNFKEVRSQSEIFREDYNKYNPHKSLGRKSLNEVL
ncbi:integrase core domain-containing protein [Tenacibaculum sediminilitoris]